MRRRASVIALLNVVTLGVYSLYWWYAINRDLRDLGRAKGAEGLGERPWLSALAFILGTALVVPFVWTIISTTGRLRRARELAGIGGRTPMVWLVLGLWIVARVLAAASGVAGGGAFGIEAAVGILVAVAAMAYMQDAANDVWDTTPELVDPNPGRRFVPYFLLGPGIVWLILFFVVPMYFMARLSLYSGTLESGFDFSWNFSNYSDSLTLYDTQFLRSLVYAGSATLLCLAIGYPLAYAIAFKAGRWRNALLFLVIAPFFTTYLIRTLAWETILSDQSPVVSVLDAFGLTSNGRVLATGPAVIAGLTYNFLPFMVLPLYASLERVDERLIEAATDLYASASTAFRKVTLPLTLPGIVAGTLLTFIPAAGDYVNAFFLGGPGNKMIGNTIQSLYLTQRDYPAAAALSFVLLAAIMALVLIYVKFAGSEALMGEEAAAGA